MDKATKTKVFSGMLGMSVIVAGSGLASVAAPANAESLTDGSDTNAKHHATFDNAEVTQGTRVSDSGLVEVANVEGAFSFNQGVISPADDVFNLFGSVVTGLCAKPIDSTYDQTSTYYINVGGDMIANRTIDLSEENLTKQITMCACATGAATAQAEVMGVKLSDILPLTDLDESVNTLQVTGSDGYVSELPLQFALEHEAMIAYQLNGQDMPNKTQMWIPGAVAQYFTRDVVDVKVLSKDKVPTIDQRADELRAEVVISNYAGDADLRVGQELTFEGYADDLGSPIAAIEFSLDGGQTWSTYETDDTRADRWVHWNFAYTPEKAGTYALSVRAVTASGIVSPLAADIAFSVGQQ